MHRGLPRLAVGRKYVKLRMSGMMKQFFQRILHDESGQDLIEYALVAAFIAIVAISGLNGLASKINSEYTKIGNNL
jgi:pilus assembly protein Flp/PilA